ncbi:hypothetical protein [Burkholderia sp. PU8-34]
MKRNARMLHKSRARMRRNITHAAHAGADRCIRQSTKARASGYAAPKPFRAQLSNRAAVRTVVSV